MIRNYILEYANDPNNPSHLKILATKYFGTTTNPKSAGYMLDDGTMLDLSGRKFGSLSDSREMDHRDINMAFEDLDDSKLKTTSYGRITPESNSFYMIHFMNMTKSIRMALYGDSLNLDFETKPTPSQKLEIDTIIATYKIKEVVVDYKGDSLLFDDPVEFQTWLDKK
jgi:hypothetical protein